MRASTIVFLLIFAGVFGHLRRHGDDANASADAPQSAGLARHLQELDQQMKASEKRFQRNARVLGELEKSLGRLQDVVSGAKVELARSVDRGDDPVTIEKRRQNVRRLERDLEEVLGGYRKLELEQERLQGENASLSARMQLARAGIWDEAPAEASPTQPRLDRPAAIPERPSPLDALTQLTGVRD